MIFAELCKAAPELFFIQKDAKKTLKPGDYEQYERLKDRMILHAGFIARRGLPEFHYTAEAYDVAHAAIFGGLI
jgi:hypothetical protein